MSIQIYKPNKSNTGFAFSFYMGENQKGGLLLYLLMQLLNTLGTIKEKEVLFPEVRTIQIKIFPSNLMSLSVAPS